MKIDLTGRVAVVTGGSRGIGQGIAATLHAAGAKVAIFGRDAAGQVDFHSASRKCVTSAAVPSETTFAPGTMRRDRKSVV